MDASRLVLPARGVWGLLGDGGVSDLFTLQTSLSNARADLADAQAHGTPDDVAQSQAIVNHLAAQVDAGTLDPTAAAQAVADNQAALKAFSDAQNADPAQTAGKTWLQWFAGTSAAAAIIKTGAFTSGATGFNQTAVSAAILKYDDPRLNAAGANAAGKAVGDFLGKYWKVLLVGVGLAVAGGAYKRVRG